MELTSLGYTDLEIEGVKGHVPTNEAGRSCEGMMAGTNRFTLPSLQVSLEYTSLVYGSRLLS